MAYKDSSVAYGFGQLGSGFSDADAIFSPPSGKVIVAITFLEDTTLTALTPATDMYTDGTTGAADIGASAFIGSTTVVGGNGTNAQAIDSGTIFPKGLTIYGRWTSVDPSAASTTGGMIFYFGM